MIFITLAASFVMMKSSSPYYLSSGSAGSSSGNGPNSSSSQRVKTGRTLAEIKKLARERYVDSDNLLKLSLIAHFVFTGKIEGKVQRSIKLNGPMKLESSNFLVLQAM